MLNTEKKQFTRDELKEALKHFKAQDSEKYSKKVGYCLVGLHKNFFNSDSGSFPKMNIKLLFYLKR